MNIVAIIPARGGSKEIKRKNIRELCGKPLIAHIIEVALKVKNIDRVIVSTDDNEIAEIAKKYGAEVPFIGPKKLSKDETPTTPVVQHAVRYLEEKENYKPDIVVLLYATSPLVKPEKISEGIRTLKEEKFDSILSVVEDRGHYWIEKGGKYERLYPKAPKNRQFNKPLLRGNGAFCIYRKNILMKGAKRLDKNRGFLVMQKGESIDIDDLLDFKIAEFLIKQKRK